VRHRRSRALGRTPLGHPYGPHLPFGSSDKLYEITPELTQIIRPESSGGTPANRMIHKESNQLAIGP